MPYQIIIEKTAQKDILKINRSAQITISQSISLLADEPRPSGCIKLKGREAWRIRVGDYRVIYEINDKVLIVKVVTVSHRRDVYKK
jgi:mRNA interferase RelE/StbE